MHTLIVDFLRNLTESEIYKWGAYCPFSIRAKRRTQNFYLDQLYGAVVVIINLLSLSSSILHTL